MGAGFATRFLRPAASGAREVWRNDVGREGLVVELDADGDAGGRGDAGLGERGFVNAEVEDAAVLHERASIASAGDAATDAGGVAEACRFDDSRRDDDVVAAVRDRLEASGEGFHGMSAQEDADGVGELAFGFDAALVGAAVDLVDQVLEAGAVGARVFEEESVEAGETFTEQAREPRGFETSSGTRAPGFGRQAPVLEQVTHSFAQGRPIGVAQRLTHETKLALARWRALDQADGAHDVDQLFGQLELGELLLGEQAEILAQARERLLDDAVGALDVAAGR
jgi:hypothetical protein